MLSAAPPTVGRPYQDPPQLCPYAAAGHCYYEDNCTYLHGDLCEVCRLQVLHPHDAEQRRAHEKVSSGKVCRYSSGGIGHLSDPADQESEQQMKVQQPGRTVQRS